MPSPDIAPELLFSLLFSSPLSSSTPLITSPAPKKTAPFLSNLAISNFFFFFLKKIYSLICSVRDRDRERQAPPTWSSLCDPPLASAIPGSGAHVPGVPREVPGANPEPPVCAILKEHRLFLLRHHPVRPERAPLCLPPWRPPLCLAAVSCWDL